MSKKSIFSIVVAALVVIGGFVLFNGIFDHNESGVTQVLQHPGGDVTFKFTPGWYSDKGFSSVEDYNQNVTVAFGKTIEGASADLDSIPVGFNDGGQARVAGMVRVQLPLDSLHMAAIRKQFKSGFQHFIQSGIAPVVQNAVSIAANMRMSQDAAMQLAAFQQDVNDQLTNGIYVTKITTKNIKNSDGTDQFSKVIELQMDSTGRPVRIPHQLMALGCSITQVKIDVPGFDESVKASIARRRELSLETENSKQRAIQAEQDALTSTKVGEANVAKKRAEFEVDKIAAVTTAEKERDVARLKKEQAEFYKQEQILQGEGESTKRRLIMNADGGLKAKLETYLNAQKAWADALGKYTGNITPVYQSGAGTSGTNAFQQFMETMAAKSAKDLSLDLNNRK